MVFLLSGPFVVCFNKFFAAHRCYQIVVPKPFYKIAQLVSVVGFSPTVEQSLNTRHNVIQYMCKLLQCLNMHLHIVTISSAQQLQFRIRGFWSLVPLKFEPLLYSIVCNGNRIHLVRFNVSEVVVPGIFLHYTRIYNGNKITFPVEKVQYRKVINPCRFHYDLNFTVQFL